MKVLVLFYSTNGHIYQLAQAVADGAREVPGVDLTIKRVPETLPPDVVKTMGATGAQQSFANVPVATVDDVTGVDAIIFGTPARFGIMAGQMHQFLTTCALWAQGKLVGKVGSVFTSSATEHVGQESTILSFHTTLLHHGMVIVWLPYTFQGQAHRDEIAGESPYKPSENELASAKFQGRHVALFAKKLSL